jgi:invasion protein IalB
VRASCRSLPGAMLAVFLTLVPQTGSAEPPAPLTSPKLDLPPSEPEVAPREKRASRDIKYAEWRKLCFKAPGKDALCRTTTTGTWDTGQIAIRLDLIERGSGARRLQVFLPVGVYLQAGVRLRLDPGSREISLPYSWCFANLCVAAVVADNTVIEALESSRKVSVDIVNTNLAVLTSTVPMDQFAAAHRGPPAQVFEQVIDE